MKQNIVFGANEVCVQVRTQTGFRKTNRLDKQGGFFFHADIANYHACQHCQFAEVIKLDLRMSKCYYLKYLGMTLVKLLIQKVIIILFSTAEDEIDEGIQGNKM